MATARLRSFEWDWDIHDVYTEYYIVTDAIDPHDAGSADGLPEKGDSLPGYPLLTVRRLRIRPIDDQAISNAYEATVEYRVGGSGFEITNPVVTWDFGVATQHIETDLNGHMIGATYLWDSNKVVRTGNPIGTDVYIPTMELHIDLPASFSTYIDPVTVGSLMGKVNAAPYNVGGVIFPDGYLLFNGAQVTWQADGTTTQSYSFTYGARELPASPNAYWNTDLTGGQIWQYDGYRPVPIAFACYETYVDDSVQNPFNTQEFLPRRKANAIWVAQVYQTGDFASLGMLQESQWVKNI